MYRFRDTLPIDISEQTISGDLVTIDNSEEMGVIDSLSVSLSPIQEGSGTPSPDNVRPISGRTEVVTWDDPKYGGTVAWNQLCNHGNFDATNGWEPTRGTGSVSGNVYSYTYTELGTGNVSANRTERQDINIPATHKVLISAMVKCAHAVPKIALILGTGNGSQIERPISSTNWTNVSTIFNTISGSATRCGIGFNCTAEFAVNDVTQLKDFMCIDLTQMFGSTIADEIYAMEQTTVGSGVAWFKNLFPKDYYAYNTGETTCVSAVNGDEYHQYTTALGRTVYGGTLDVVSGELVVDRAMVTLDGTQQISLTNWRATSAGVGWIYPYSLTNNKVERVDSIVPNLISDKFETITYGEAYRGEKNGVTTLATTGSTSYGLVVRTADTTLTTASAINAYLSDNPITVCYELATPQTYQLTPQQIDLLLGTNHLWSDGEISVVWHKDLTKGRILPAEAVSINGQYIENVLDGYRTLYTKGRESLGAKLETYSVGTADGEKFKNKRYPARTITVGFQLIGANPQDFRQKFNNLNNLLSIEEADFIFNDETDKFFSGYPIMDASVEAGQDSVKGEWKIYCTYPFKRSVEPIKLTMEDATVTDTTATFTIDYKGARPARPVLRAKFAGAKSGGSSSEDGDCGFVAFMDGEENIIQLGNPEIVDLDEYVSAETLLNKEFVNVSDWTRTGGHTYKGIVTGSVSTSDATDAFWNGGAGQTQTYAKPSYGSGSDLHGAILWKNTAGAVNFTMNMVHRLCCANPSETGVFECGAYNHDTGVLVAGFIIDKSANGTTGIVRYIVNGVQVGTDQIDLSYYNTHFGYCNRTPVYVEESYYDPYVEEIIIIKRHKKKKKIKRRRYITKSKIHWWARTRTVLSGWNYTQSNLNSSIQKDGSYVYFQVGNLPMRTFNVPSVAQVLAHDASVYMGTYGTALNTNMIHSLLFRRDAGVPFAEQPNVFTSGDIVEADCNEATVYIYRDGSIGGHLEPQFGALGNDWESFMLTSGTNVIRATWSEWVNTAYKPQIEIEYNEVFI